MLQGAGVGGEMEMSFYYNYIKIVVTGILSWQNQAYYSTPKTAALGVQLASDIPLAASTRNGRLTMRTSDRLLATPLFCFLTGLLSLGPPAFAIEFVKRSAKEFTKRQFDKTPREHMRLRGLHKADACLRKSKPADLVVPHMQSVEALYEPRRQWLDLGSASRPS